MRLEEEDVPGSQDPVKNPVMEHIIERILNRDASSVQDVDELAFEFSLYEMEDAQNGSISEGKNKQKRWKIYFKQSKKMIWN